MNDSARLLVLDTATRTPVLGLADGSGLLVAQRRWRSAHRHGEQLLPELDVLLAEGGVTPRQLTGIGVGFGPGSFTGLRIGLATAKVLAHSLGLPVVGLSTTRALALAAGVEGEVAVTLPAGVADRYVHRLRVGDAQVEEIAAPQLTATPETFGQAVGGARLLAVDMQAEDISADAQALGIRAGCELAGALARLATRALAEGRTDDVAALVPAYIALPRGVAQAAEEIQWSADPR